MLASALLAFVSLVEGESCPAPIDVELRVRAILQLAPEQQLSEGFAIERREAGLYVALRRADATLIGERVLPTSGSCDELAQAAAVVLSAWLTDVHPDFAGALPPPAPAPPEPAPSPAPPAAPTPAPPASAPGPAPARASAPTPPPRRPAAAPSWRLLLGLGGDLSGGALTPAAIVAASYGAERTGLAWGLRCLFTWPRDEPLGPGQVSWWRWPLALGPSLRVEGSSLAWSLSVGPAAAWLHLVGDSFDRTSSQNAISWGGFAEVMVAGSGRPLAPFGVLSTQIYPAEAKAYVQAQPPLEWQLPRLSLTLALGVSFSP